MSSRSTSNESAQSTLHQSPNNRKLKSPNANSVPIVYSYQNYPQSESDAEEKKSQGDFDLHIKLLMLGDSGVGKSSLVLQYAHEEFTSNFVTTIGIDYKIKLLKIGKTKIKLQIWDTVRIYPSCLYYRAFSLFAMYMYVNISRLLGWSRTFSYHNYFLF